ncbi:MAG TPA: hypothetical protein VLH75_19955 [Longimicrobiales bacterium]|nr:hypothetical protein [Longimicrobiales bacterium]
MYRLTRLFPTALAIVAVAACSEAPQDPVAPITTESNIERITGFTPAELSALPAPTRIPLVTARATLGGTVLDFEDLPGGQFPMYPYNPYHGVSFSGSGYCPAVYVWDYTPYGSPVSGTHFLFNGCGYDNESMTLTTPQAFKGAWVANPHYQNPSFQFDLYLAGNLVASSSSVALQPTMQWVPSGHNGPVDQVVLRIPNGYWWVMDDVTFGPPNPTTKDDCKDGGWAQYGFRNQGLCVSYVETGKDTR